MNIKNILLLCGGNSSEHEISIISANFIEQCLKNEKEINLIRICISKSGEWINQKDNKPCILNFNKELSLSDNSVIKIDYAIPCFHGFPGETGDIQSFFNLMNLPFLGCGSEASVICFNKISTKLWLSAINIPNTPFIFLTKNDTDNIQKAHVFFSTHNDVFVKAASQGSSVGCYHVTNENELDKYIIEAFNYSDSVLIEKAVKPRELEIAAYEYKGEIIITNPGEIITDKDVFYTYEEKYNSSSKASTKVEAELPDNIKNKIKEYALMAFKNLKLKDLSRIDFFLVNDNEILLNEINTFPGMTPISMFPQMMKNYGHNMTDYLLDRINSSH